ncbi:MAG: cell division control protein 14 [Cirrosporium novae-zelandiae]|nr:MAG: cell division control protein 14 [Cirrosporium novae-zelandiae]
MPSHTSGNNNYGQVIEYIHNRLYLASYTQAPRDDTPFPYPIPAARSPSKRSSRSQHGPTGLKSNLPPPVYFTVDDVLLYNAFHADFGPLHIAHLYRFSVYFHEILGDPLNQSRPVVFWSKPDPRSRANAACLVACYMVMIQHWPPHLALAPISQMDPPVMPFRDAGYSQADYIITIQDVVYGVWKAKEEGLCGLKDFDLEEYEKYERVDMGDFNWLTPHFLAFASPQHSPTSQISSSSSLYASLPKSVNDVLTTELPTPFKNVLAHFSSRDIGLVVRLNSELYSSSYFTALGIHHLDMIFDDGTCPPLPLVRKFIKLAHDTITNKGKGVAVHCKAGLGRTGCLIGAYLIYRYGFTANEIIAFMRFMRPGMVVGPQQHWLHLNQGAFREWWVEDKLRKKLAAAMPTTPTKESRSRNQCATPGSQHKRAALGEINNEASSAASAHMEENLPAPTPGQPRKSARVESRHHPYSRNASTAYGIENEMNEKTSTEMVSMRAHRQSEDGAESEEEYQLRMLTRRPSRSPSSSPGKEAMRSISYSTTTTTTMFSVSDNGAIHEDVENWQTIDKTKTKTPTRAKSGNGSGTIGVRKVRGNSKRTVSKGEGNGVRKTSGRVASGGLSTKTK